MPELKRSLVSGYTVESVHEVIEDLQIQHDRLNKKLRKQEAQINELKQERNYYRDKERLIADALLDAKQLSASIISDAQIFATNARKTTEQEIAERVEEFKHSMAQLETVKQEIVAQEEVLKFELKNVLKKYMNVVDSTQLPEFHTIKEGLNTSFKEAHMLMDAHESFSESEQIESEPEIEEDDIPVYDFTAIV